MIKILESIVHKIRVEIYLYLLAWAVICYLIGNYDFDKLIAIKGLLIVIFSGGTLLIALQSWWAYKIQTDEKGKIIKSLDEKLQNMGKEKSKLLEDLRQKSPVVKVERGLDAYSINLDLETPQELVDEDHHYTKLVYHAEINRKGDYKARYERYGKRLTEGMTKSLLIQTGASSSVLYNDLGIRAFNAKTDKRFRDECVDDNMYKKMYRIHLDPAAKKFEEFAIGWTFMWPRCAGGKRDSDTINLKGFKKGSVDEIVHTLVFPFEVSHPLLQEIVGESDKPVDCAVQPKLTVKDGKYYYSYTIKKPRVDGYLFSWFTPEY